MVTIQRSSLHPVDTVIDCHSAGEGNKLSAMEWTYKGTTFKSQIGGDRPVTLVREDVTNWPGVAKRQTADTAGKLVFTNLDDADLLVDCAYLTGPDPYAKK